jgi:hypothetical protein
VPIARQLTDQRPTNAARGAAAGAAWRTIAEGVQDDRPEIVEHWRTAGTWLRSPILVAGEAFGSSLTDECLVGFTRLGNLLALLDRQAIPKYATHRVWLGTIRSPPASLT